MSIISFVRNHWIISIILILALVIGLRIAYVHSERYDYKYYNPLAYCQKYPDGKFKDKALNRIIYSLHRDLQGNVLRDFSFNFYFHDSERELAEFAEKYSSGESRKRLEELCDIYYLKLKERYGNSVIPDDLVIFKEKVEDKYHLEIERRRAWLQQQWENESSAWALASRDSVSVSEAISAIYMYLEHHPRGAHALDAYELKEELYLMLPEESEEE